MPDALTVNALRANRPSAEAGWCYLTHDKTSCVTNANRRDDQGERDLCALDEGGWHRQRAISGPPRRPASIRAGQQLEFARLGWRLVPRARRPGWCNASASCRTDGLDSVVLSAFRAAHDPAVHNQVQRLSMAVIGRWNQTAR